MIAEYSADFQFIKRINFKYHFKNNFYENKNFRRYRHSSHSGSYGI
jgi:hypothetical protein